MGNRLPWVLFALSLALNVFFIGGALYYRATAEQLRNSSDDRIEALAEQLSLDESQRQGLLTLREELGAMRRSWREAREPRLEVMWQVLAEESYDRERMAELIAAGGEERVERLVTMGEMLHSYMASLKPEQREEFLELMRDRKTRRALFARGRD